MSELKRRSFLQGSLGVASALTALNYAHAADEPNEKVRLAVMGVRGRGRQLIQGFTALPDVEIVALVDPDENVVPQALKTVAERQRREPTVEKDIRKVLENRDVQGVIIAAPDHWHALGTIWACQAGKDVYVEKPLSHNLVEGRRMVDAARRYNRIVQVGTQRRSGGHYISAAEFVRSGKLGKIPFARTWIAGNRRPIGKRADAAVPNGVDYDLWLGPAPQRAFNPNRFHYNWHWFWDYGTGELGNNGIHALDLARWLLNLEAPTRISSGGGKFFYDDDQETPDTHMAVYDFANCSILWEHRIWSRTGFEGEPWGVVLYGEKGNLIFDKDGWHVQDGDAAADKTQPTDAPHYRNFVDCIKSRRRPNADVEEGHKSARLCHLGNIAIRTSKTLQFDVKTETTQDADANRLLSRTYRRPFEVPERP
jgi:predicted dehydrogenase